MFFLFLQENLYQWLYFINIMSNGCVYFVYAFDVVCDNKEFLMKFLMKRIKIAERGLKKHNLPCILISKI